MDREWLERELTAGRSIESLAREVGSAPSTVAYWVNTYGLASAHRERHAPRGGTSRDELAALVDRGLSVRAMASELGVSYATVQHWLRRHGLKTARAIQRAERRVGADAFEAVCPRHGRTAFVRRSDGGGNRCLRCRADAVVARRRRVKEALIAAAGGACVLCGYDRSPAALHFHHLDPAEKVFALADGGLARSLDTAMAEAAKCVLLCATCHAEVEAGDATLPALPADQSRG
jgi:hypothetical protein